MDVAAALAAGSLIKRSQTRESFVLGFFFFPWLTLGADCTRQVRRVEGAGLVNVTAATAAAGVDVFFFAGRTRRRQEGSRVSSADH